MATLLRDLIRVYGHDPERVVALVRAMGGLAVDHLVPSLEDDDPFHRCIAAQMLALIDDRRAVEPLVAALNVRGLVTERMLREMIRNQDGYPSWGCYLGLPVGRSVFHNAMLRVMKQLHADVVSSVQVDVAFALGILGDERAREPLTRLLHSRDSRVADTSRQALTILEMKVGYALA